MSIPRDTLVTRPDCTKADGSSMASAERVMFNSIYSQAGPACVVKTVEKMSGVRMDHYVEIDFAGFQGSGRRDRRGHRHRRPGHPRPVERARPGRRHAQAERDGVPPVRPDPARGRRRQRPGAHRPPAGVHDGPAERDQEAGPAGQPHQDLQDRRHSDRGPHHRLRTRLAHRAGGLRTQSERCRPLHHGDDHAPGGLRQGRPQPGGPRRAAGVDAVEGDPRRPGDSRVGEEVPATGGS